MKKIGNYFFPDTDIHFQRWVLDGEYQKKQRDDVFLKMNSIKPVKRICDIGGHVGTWSLPMAQYKDTEMIYAFEPNEKVRECFVENTLPFKDKITVYNVALGKENGKALLDIEEDNTGNTRIKVVNETDLKTIEVRTLDSFELKNIDYMKIDVEGFEMNVIKGSQMKLKEIPFILLENQFGNHYKNNNFKDIIKFLSKKNFVICKKFIYPTLHYQDVLFKKI